MRPAAAPVRPRRRSSISATPASGCPAITSATPYCRPDVRGALHVAGARAQRIAARNSIERLVDVAEVAQHDACGLVGDGGDFPGAAPSARRARCAWPAPWCGGTARAPAARPVPGSLGALTGATYTDLIDRNRALNRRRRPNWRFRTCHGRSEPPQEGAASVQPDSAAAVRWASYHTQRTRSSGEEDHEYLYDEDTLLMRDADRPPSVGSSRDARYAESSIRTPSGGQGDHRAHPEGSARRRAGFFAQCPIEG